MRPVVTTPSAGVPDNPYAAPAQGSVDRAALLLRHSPSVRRLDPRSPLQVGNGEFAFTADVTGLQTFPDAYPVTGSDGAVVGTLLGTMTQWAWHSVPFGAQSDDAAGTPLPTIDDCVRDYPSVRGPVPYVDLSYEQWGAPTSAPTVGEDWLRANPHRLDVGRVSLWCSQGIAVNELTDVDQHLDLASGVLTSRFRVRGVAFTVTTVVHPEHDELAVRVERRSEHGTAEAFGIELAFPYGSQSWGGSQDWESPHAHRTRVDAGNGSLVVVERVLDATTYHVVLRSQAALEPVSEHGLRLVATGDAIELVARFCRGSSAAASTSAAQPSHGVDEVIGASTRWWGRFWSSGAAISFDGTDDPRAAELERRIVLSQYLVAVNCAGSTPPAETGLVVNSWRGKFHLEMLWWHVACFPLWGRPELLERSMAWYPTILEAARATARRQGLRGARWPKQTDPSGAETPSSIGPFLVWQQPHPIYLAELLYRARPRRETLLRWAQVVRETADFMASYAWREPDGFHLPAPLVPAQESYARERAVTQDPTFELAYWAWAMRTAVTWCERLGEPAPDLWVDVAEHMAAPQTRNGIYPAVGVEPWTIRTDHPAVLGALGFVPDTGLVDPATMAATLADIAIGDESAWDWPSVWGWDFPLGAMTAARLGLADLAVDWLLADAPKNEHLPNGHSFQTAELPVYLPGNGGLLAAVALMAAGWDASPDRPTPGFPRSWAVAAEGFVRLP
ncbi:hypothetical protein [Miniimonas arenae]|uniref:hypothetical protein n=1 Tax=Miniimonas arenae TaxID=676201 RepID=UPI00406BA2CF